MSGHSFIFLTHSLLTAPENWRGKTSEKDSGDLGFRSFAAP